jgi:hypothetical protein
VSARQKKPRLIGDENRAILVGLIGPVAYPRAVSSAFCPNQKPLLKDVLYSGDARYVIEEHSSIIGYISLPVNRSEG